ncbi:COMM domain-containing protein 6 [Bulinus truncatus]|nr:COMM domain-containing protein 6 [Bulinus truncatus]
MPGTDHIAQITDVDIKWKVSMAVSSNDVKNLHQPMITMMLVTTDYSGNKKSWPVEMTTSKFKELFGTVKEISAQMDNAKIL